MAAYWVRQSKHGYEKRGNSLVPGRRSSRFKDYRIKLRTAGFRAPSRSGPAYATNRARRETDG